MNNQHMVYNHPLLNEKINQYQEAQGLQSWSAAATELIIMSIQAWIDQDPSNRAWGIDKQQQTALNVEYEAWRTQQFALMGYDYGFEPFATKQEEDLVTFSRFILDQVSPKRGGNRLGGGRPKGSKNKKSVPSDPELDEPVEF